MQGHLYFVAMFGILCDHGMPSSWWDGPRAGGSLHGMAALLDVIGPTPLGLGVFFAVAGANDARAADSDGPPPTLRATVGPLLYVWAAMCGLDLASDLLYGAVRAATGVCVRSGSSPASGCVRLDGIGMVSFWETKWFALVLALYRGLGWAVRYAKPLAGARAATDGAFSVRSKRLLTAFLALAVFSYATAADDGSIAVHIPNTGTGRMKIHKLAAGLFYVFAPPLLPDGVLTPRCSAYDRVGDVTWGGLALPGSAARRWTGGLLAAHVFASLTAFGYGGAGYLAPGASALDWFLTLIRGGYSAINLIPNAAPGLLPVGFWGSVLFAGAAAVGIVGLVGAAAYWVPRSESYWSDVGAASINVYMLHRFFLPPLHTLFYQLPWLVSGDVFVGVPLFLAVHAFLAVELGALVHVARSAYAGLRPPADADEDRASLLADDKHTA